MPHRRSCLYLLLAAGIGAAACGPAPDSAPSNPAATEPPAATSLVRVVAARVETGALTDRIELSGRLEPWVEVRVASELGGFVEEVAFQKGALVREGQVLARVGTDLHQAALEEAEAVLAGAEATFNRARELVERQAVPRQNLITATAEYEAARARVAQNRLRLERSIVRAPVTGVAIARDLEPGEVLAPGTSITTIHRLDRVKAVVGIPENDIGFFRQGSAAAVRVDAWPDRTFEGRIQFVAPSASATTRTFTAEIGIGNADGALKPGMIVRVSLVRRAYDSAIVVPRDVLQERDLGTVAVVLEGDIARVRSVSLGAVEGDQVLVTDGLVHGEWLIVGGHRGLVDGQRVQVVERRE